MHSLGGFKTEGGVEPSGHSAGAARKANSDMRFIQSWMNIGLSVVGHLCLSRIVLQSTAFFATTPKP